ncbi:Gfo/Idh/MocA family protein [Rubinisphaera margarita]|uniref:Gfo/Idh/MocA family protein n=1 Tax=Rubinisphaera margarita TaxID=2909586 RepID=UPI001EE8AFF7|nr:Gfo/Idh/MocA family oxidoreductase [Rubinisphaera margarita]MCG6154982.1 Gfo/Idh/MocA family oxidoreductase [Rubinisphaera margarita]
MKRVTQNRRQFLQTTGALSAGLFVSGLPARASASPNEKLNLAIIGCGHKGWHNVTQLTHENIAVLCDIDANLLGKAAETHSQARQYRDYRDMLDKEAQHVDAVVVSTADHSHAPATIRALDLKKPVYCEKPLTHTVAEARAIAEKAEETGVATQMGTQIHASDNYRRVVELLQSKVIGEVTEVYHWCNKGWSEGRYVAWDKPIPAHVDWDLFLGPAKKRPYSPNVHPSNWRRFWDFGMGTFGDMGCHIMDLSFWGLELTHPTRVKANGPEVHPDGCPTWCQAEYDFPAIKGRPALKLYWSDGGKHHDMVANTTDANGKPLSGWGIGVLYVGTKGMLAANYSQRQLLPGDKFADVKPPEETIPASVGHWVEWTNAIKNGTPTTCPFRYSGRLTETVLLGPVAFRTGKELQWDAASLKATNAPEASQFVHKDYRSGWEVQT